MRTAQVANISSISHNVYYLTTLYHCLSLLSHCKYLIINITIISLYISSSHCKYHHCSFVSVIIHSLSACSLLNHLDHIFVLNLYHYSIELCCGLCQIQGLRIFNHTLPDWCIGDLYSCYLFFTILCGLLSLSSATWGGAALHLSPPLGFCLGFLLVGELQLDQISFDPLPSLPRNQLVRLHQESSPGCLASGAQQACFMISSVCFTLHPIWRCCIARLRYANRHVDQPVHPRCWLGPVSANNPKFWYLQGSWSWWSEYCI